MSIIVISSNSYRKGRQIAEKSADILNYRYLDREILSSVAATYDVSETRLTRALDELPSFPGMSAKVRNRCLAYIQEAVLGQLLQDGVVCHGLAAHLYAQGVSHVLRVRILSDPQEMAAEIAARMNVSPERAQKKVKSREKHRRRWSLDAFKLDETDPSRFDLVVSLSQIDPDEAVQIITDTAGYRRFEPMTYSIKCMKDRELASRVRAALVGRFFDVRVEADGDAVVVETRGLKREKRKKTEAIKKLAEKIPGVGDVQVHIINDIFRQAVESFR